MGLSMDWNLDDLYTGFDSEKFKSDLAGLKKAIADLTEFAKKELTFFSDPVKCLEKYIEMMNNISRFENLSYYCQLVMSVDSKNDKAAKFDTQIENILTDLAKPEVLFKQYIAGLKNLNDIIDKSPVLKEHRFILNEIQASCKYMLSEQEETVISKLTTTGSSAWGNMKELLFATLMADITIDGETKRLPMTAIRNLAYNNDAAKRKAAYEAELRAYKNMDKAASFALNNIKGEVITLCKIRGYESPLSKTLIDSRMNRRTLDAMFSAMDEYFPVFRKYLRKKAEMLGHKNGLPFYDLFAPVGTSKMHFSYDEAADFIYKNFSSFSKKLGDFAKAAFEKNWIDASIHEGKRGGAFCENLHSIGQSRVMTNFSGTFNDVLTLAHELGHAYHGDCLKNETPLNSDYCMPIAETASTFCETLICDAALQTAPKEDRITILENDISSSTQVIVDIYSRFLFEDKVINSVEEGPLSVDELNHIMLDAQKQTYGNGLDENYMHPYMWACKPHYYYADANYYNFPYAYGQLFSKGLYAKYKKEGEAFVPEYDRMLAATGKNTLEDIASLMGIDVSGKAFWRSSLELIKEEIEKFCAL